VTHHPGGPSAPVIGTAPTRSGIRVLALAPVPRAVRPAERLVRAVLTLGCLVLAAALAGVVAILNQPYFDLVNGWVGARETVARALVFSSWLVLVGGVVVVWRPAAFGFRLGDIGRRARLIVGTLVVAIVLTALILRLSGAIPYSDASLLVESVVVPLTEELVFRAVLLTLLLVLLLRLHDAGTAAVLAVAGNGLAFGLAHLANATSLDPAFVVAQATFASVLGMGCAFLMVRTRSVYPAIALHAAVNAVVVLTS
jgi:membrane protease YdiL (CAAX protease family)